MQRRNSYSDLGLVVAVSVFICILLKCLLFGFTWVGIIWLILSCAYFYVSWRYPSEDKVLKHATTLFLLLSVVAIVGIALFDKNARPVMHAFQGTGDTIQDAVIEEEEPIVPIYVPVPEDTLQEDTASSEQAVTDSILLNNDENIQMEVAADSTITPK
ncbi:MAG: hypothetical protein IJ693_03165 [Bacteroidaceae bacterium]|nr:hypothetical protein [Bacteroidaceae bacterium]